MMLSSTTSTTELARFLSTTGPEQFTLSKEEERTCKTSTPFFRLRSSSHSNKKKKKQLLLQQEQRNQDEPMNVFETTPTAHSPYRFQQQQQQQRQQEQRDLYYKHHHKKHIPLPVYIPPSPSPPPHSTTISTSGCSSTYNNNNNKQHSNNSQCNTNTTKTPKNNDSSSLATTKIPSTSSSTTSIPMFPKPPSYTTLRTPVSSESIPSTKSSPVSKQEKCPHCCRRFTSGKKGLRRISCPPAIHYTPSKTTKTLNNDKINSNASKEEGGLTSREAKTLLQMIEKLQHQLVQEQTSRQALEKALQNTK